MVKTSPVMLALFFMLYSSYYALSYAGIIDAGLAGDPQKIFNQENAE